METVSTLVTKRRLRKAGDATKLRLSKYLSGDSLCVLMRHSIKDVVLLAQAPYRRSIPKAAISPSLDRARPAQNFYTLLRNALFYLSKMTVRLAFAQRPAACIA